MPRNTIDANKQQSPDSNPVVFRKIFLVVYKRMDPGKCASSGSRETSQETVGVTKAEDDGTLGKDDDSKDEEKQMGLTKMYEAELMRDGDRLGVGKRGNREESMTPGFLV